MSAEQRATFFRGLATLTFCLIFVGLVLSYGETQAGDLSDWLGGVGGFAIVLCAGIPLLVVFLLLMWRNEAEVRNEQRHQELLAAQGENNDQSG